MSPRTSSTMRMTPRRVTALRDVRRKAVKYDARLADWVVDGEAVSGWTWRTLSNLRESGLVKVSASGDATLTAKGVRTLDAVPGDPEESTAEGV